MLLPRMVFKADLVIDQLRQQVQHIHIHTQLTCKQAHLAVKYDLIISSTIISSLCVFMCQSYKCIFYTAAPARSNVLIHTSNLHLISHWVLQPPISLLYIHTVHVFSLHSQFKMDDALGSLSKLGGTQLDQVVFASFLVYKLSVLQLLVARAKK